MVLFNLVGKIIGKSLFERIPLNIYIDRTLIKHILNQKVYFDDLQHYDSQVNIIIINKIFIYCEIAL